MTTPLYYQSPDLLDFDAVVVAAERRDDTLELILDQTAFYPEGGGQPADRGVIGGLQVKHVRKADAGIVHEIDLTGYASGDSRLRAGDSNPGGGDTGSPAGDSNPGGGTPSPAGHLTSAHLAPGAKVTGAVDAAHRRDYMQQHSGQHILSGALIAVGGYETVSVHQGADYTTIEVSAPEIPPKHLTEVEARANEAVMADLPITAQVVHESEIHTVPLRRPPKVSGDIRVVRVGELDCVACGGVHCNRTGEIRLVRLFSVETIRGNVRMAWKIGDRALAHYRETSSVVSDLVAELSAKPEEILPRVQQLDGRIRELESEVKRHKQAAYELVARSLVTEAEPERGQRVITAEFSGEPSDYLRGLTEILVEQNGVVVCLTNRTDDRLQWSVGTGPGARFSFNDEKAELLALIGGKGGGRPPIWQGVGEPDGDVAGFLSEFKRRAERA